MLRDQIHDLRKNNRVFNEVLAENAGCETMKNTYRIERSPNGSDWYPVGEFEARSRMESVLAARRRDKSSDVHWRTTLIACKSGRGLGMMKVCKL